MKRQTQHVYECARCGRIFEDGEDFWYKSFTEQYCIDCDELEGVDLK
jgi:DNA-directed RNA polymerase subunit RPC12/RpoP